MTRLGWMIRIYRVYRGIGVRVLAKEIGISAATVSRIERGGEMDVATLLKVLAWLREPEDK